MIQLYDRCVLALGSVNDRRGVGVNNQMQRGNRERMWRKREGRNRGEGGGGGIYGIGW